MDTLAARRDLGHLRELYATGFHDATLNGALRKTLERQVARDEADLEGVDGALAGFERQYGMGLPELLRVLEREWSLT